MFMAETRHGTVVSAFEVAAEIGTLKSAYILNLSDFGLSAFLDTTF